MIKAIPYSGEYQQDVVRLLGIFWKQNEKLAYSFFQWKYLDCPYAKSINIALLLQGDTVVGMRGAYVLPLRLGREEEPINVACIGDTFVEKVYRGRNGFNLLTTCLFNTLSRNGFSLALNMGATKRVWSVSVKKGWHSTESFFHWYKRSDERLKGASGFGLSDRAIGFVQPTEAGNLVYSNEVYPKQMASLCQTPDDEGDFSFFRDQQYFNWRYFRPGNGYRFIYLFDHEENKIEQSQKQPVSTRNLKGFLVLGCAQSSTSSTGYLADWAYCDADSLETMISLFMEINPFYEMHCIGAEGSKIIQLLSQKCPSSANVRNEMQSRILAKSTALDSTLPAKFIQQHQALSTWRHTAINLDWA